MDWAIAQSWVGQSTRNHQRPSPNYVQPSAAFPGSTRLTPGCPPVCLLAPVCHCEERSQASMLANPAEPSKAHVRSSERDPRACVRGNGGGSGEQARYRCEQEGGAERVCLPALVGGGSRAEEEKREGKIGRRE